MRRLSQLAEIGAEGHAGAFRAGLSDAEQRACQLVAGWLEQEGMTVSWDASGNLYGRLAGTDPAAAEVWSGSHLDTVPNGGRFDGALGVLAALEAVRRCVRRLLRQRWPWSHSATRRAGGSARLLRQPLRLRHRVRGRPRGDRRRWGIGAPALAALGYPAPLGGVTLPAAFVEAHVEQGPVLEQRGLAPRWTADRGLVGFTAEVEGGPGTPARRRWRAAPTPCRRPPPGADAARRAAARRRGLTSAGCGWPSRVQLCRAGVDSRRRPRPDEGAWWRRPPSGGSRRGRRGLHDLGRLR